MRNVTLWLLVEIAKEIFAVQDQSDQNTLKS